MTDQEIFRSWERKTRLAADGDRPLVTYTPTRTTFVPFEVCEAAKGALVIACADLALNEPRLLWFEKALFDGRRLPDDVPRFTHPAIRGIAHRAAKSIGLRADLTRDQAAETAAHEAYHLTQPDGADDEAEAEVYGRKVGALIKDHCLWNGRVPVVHEGVSRVDLYGVAEPGDVLVERARGGKRRAVVNIGLKRSPRWWPVAASGG